MAVLSDPDRSQVWAQAMRERANFGGIPGITKQDLRAAVNAIDDWIESAQGAAAPATGFNAALPVAFRNAATLQQKTALFCFVAMRRAGLLKVAGDP